MRWVAEDLPEPAAMSLTTSGAPEEDGGKVPDELRAETERKMRPRGGPASGSARVVGPSRIEEKREELG